MNGITSVKDTYIEATEANYKGKIVGLKYIKFGEYEEYKLCYVAMDDGILKYIPMLNIINGSFKITD